MRIVIMGGTAGIGKAVALQQAAAGAEVIVTGRNTDRLAEMKPLVAHAEQVDGSDEAAVAAFFERTAASITWCSPSAPTRSVWDRSPARRSATSGPRSRVR